MLDLPPSVTTFSTLVCIIGWRLLSACSDPGKTPQTPDVLGIEDGAAGGESVRAVVDPTAGARLTLKTGATLEVANGAVTKETTVTLARPPDRDALKLTRTVNDPDAIASAPYILKPHGTQLSKEAKLSLPIAPNHQDRKVVVAWLKDEADREWKLLGTPKKEGNKAHIALAHFSVIMLIDADRVTLAAGDEDAGDDEPDAESDAAAVEGGSEGGIGGVGGGVGGNAAGGFGGTAGVDAGHIGGVLSDASASSADAIVADGAVDAAMLAGDAARLRCTDRPCGVDNACTETAGDYSCTCTSDYLQLDARHCAPRFQALAAGSGFVCGVRTDGRVACWGQIGGGLGGSGNSSSVPVDILGVSAGAFIAAGRRHACALQGDGTVACWGANDTGQLGNGTTADSSMALRVDGLSMVTALARSGCSSRHTCALHADGGVACWGANESGQLGNGTTSNAAMPVSVVGLVATGDMTKRCGSA